MESILLDTNVVSELMRSRPAEEVMEWFASRTGSTFYISAITQAEILLGIALLPEGKRRDALATAARQMFEEDFLGRCLAFEPPCALYYAEIVSSRQKSGLSSSTEDALIAAVALYHGLPFATRNIRDFDQIKGLVLYNPWQAA